MPDLSDMMPGAPLPDSDPDGTSRLVENSVVAPIDPEQLRARDHAKENTITAPVEKPKTKQWSSEEAHSSITEFLFWTTGVSEISWMSEEKSSMNNQNSCNTSENSSIHGSNTRANFENRWPHGEYGWMNREYPYINESYPSRYGKCHPNGELFLIKWEKSFSNVEQSSIYENPWSDTLSNGEYPWPAGERAVIDTRYWYNRERSSGSSYRFECMMAYSGNNT